MLLDHRKMSLLIVDTQDALLPVVRDAARLLASIQRLVEAARAFDVPVTAAEQYPSGLGRTAANVLGLLSPDEIIAKTSFSCLGEPPLRSRLEDLARHRPAVLLCGLEAHVCVLQTALDMVTTGILPIVVEDAISSRDDDDRRAALRRMARAGVTLVTTEMVIFEWLRSASHPSFKTVRKLVARS